VQQFAQLLAQSFLTHNLGDDFLLMLKELQVQGSDTTMWNKEPMFVPSKKFLPVPGLYANTLILA
jgi:hypothetical protein